MVGLKEVLANSTADLELLNPNKTPSVEDLGEALPYYWQKSPYFLYIPG